MDLFGNLDEESDEDGLSSGRPAATTKSGLVMLIDTSPNMFKVQGDNPSPFDKAIQIAVRTYKRKVIAGGKQVLSVIFFNTQNKLNSSRFDGTKQ